MKEDFGIQIGTVVGNTSPMEYKFYLKRFKAKLGDLVAVEMKIPENYETRDVLVWGRIIGLQRYNPFLPSEAGLELADEGLDLLDTVLSNSRDQIEGTVLVLGSTSRDNLEVMVPLNYPVQPGAEVRLPPAVTVNKILIGDDKETHRIKLGSIIGRHDVEVKLKTNKIVGRHMAILAMTGGGKTVASRRVIRELLGARYPLVIFDPHGDYLGFWEHKDKFSKNEIKLYYPFLSVNEENRDVISFLVKQMTQGFTDAQKDAFQNASERIKIKDKETLDLQNYIKQLISEVDSESGKLKSTISAVKRGLRMVGKHIEAMNLSNERLREKLKDYPFEPMPDPKTEPNKFVNPGQVSIIYLGGYDHLTQSTIVSIVLSNLFEERASMKNQIPPFLSVIEEAHNFIPSRGEGQMETPSVEIIRKVITEGRKFGVGLLLISQRPSRLDETTLSQCNSFMIFRLVNPRDQSFVEKVMENLTKADSRLLPGFGPGQGIVSGQAVRFPLVIKVDFDEDLISKSIGDEDFIQAVQNWDKSENSSINKLSNKLEEDLDKNNS